MSLNVPFLATKSERPMECPPSPDLSVGPDGLLYRSGSKRPFVDELLESGLCDVDGSLISIMTKAQLDPPDPDAVRRSVELSRFGPEILVTRAQTEPDDSDSIRRGGLWAMATSYTSGGRDKPDPDWTRRG